MQQSLLPGRPLLAGIMGTLFDYVCMEWMIGVYSFSVGCINNITFIISGPTWNHFFKSYTLFSLPTCIWIGVCIFVDACI